ncbi:Uncharacterised protein [uncultured archaeon]|nr:Uncharacterised protein [uncultured archaeon]
MNQYLNRELSPMRDKRFPILEDHGGLHADAASVMQNLTAYPRADGYYDYYRMSIHAASFPDEPHISPTTDVGNNPLTTGYTDVEQDMMDKAARYCGFRPKRLGTRHSEEPDYVNRKSPVNHNSGRSIYNGE